MIEAKELRIGNWVYQGLRYGDCEASSYEIYNLSLGGTSEYYKEWKPIPLTEDWLLNFGLKLDKHINGYDILVYFGDKRFWLNIAECPNESAGFHVELKHVHQLQNLYFALIGEELTIKK